MNGERNKKITILLVLSVSLIAAALTAVLLSAYYSHRQFVFFGDFCGDIIEKHPDCRQTVLKLLKAKKSYEKAAAEGNILQSFGYGQWDFPKEKAGILWPAAAGFTAGSILFLSAFWHGNRKMQDRIKMLTGYLEKINTGGQGLLLDTEEDEFSRLQDEIYKTVTALYQTRDDALRAKENFADNLANIAHQLKTPITAISLSNQMMERNPSSRYTKQMKRQLGRLIYLEEALLLLSRIDAGTLVIERAASDVFTLLTLAADNLQELSAQAGVSIDIPEMGEVDIFADLEWTMEAVMNLLKNCVEHAPKGTYVHCSYEKNPLYVQIRIWDEGSGFEKEELFRLFERFYRGKNAKNAGIGIGLSLAKALIEMQDGTIRACNLPMGGACFEICFFHGH